ENLRLVTGPTSNPAGVSLCGVSLTGELTWACRRRSSRSRDCPSGDGECLRRPRDWGATRLYPATYRRSVPEILVTELLGHVPLLPRDHAVGHQDERGDEHAHDPCAVRPYTQPELEQRERQIDGVPREAIRSRREHLRDRLPRANRCPRPLKLADRKHEQRYREQNQQDAYGLDGGGHDSPPPYGVQREACKDGDQVDYRRAREDDDSLVASDCCAFSLSMHACLPPSYVLAVWRLRIGVEVRARPSKTPMQDACRMSAFPAATTGAGTL